MGILPIIFYESSSPPLPLLSFTLIHFHSFNMLRAAPATRSPTFAGASILKQSGRRAYSPIVARSRPATAAALSRVTFHRPILRQPFRRGYADQKSGVAASETLQKVKKNRFGIFRWLWRLTYLSALGGLGYVGYGIYLSRNPEDQAEPDPNKKTLVVLGTAALWPQWVVYVGCDRI